MYLSPYQISLFQQCPLKYRLQYIDGLGDEFIRPRSYFSFGNTIHESLRDFYRLGGPSQNPFPLLYTIYRGKWEGIDPLELGFKNRKEAEDYYYRGYYMLKNFYRQHEHEEGETLSLEETYEREMSPGITLGGKIDRIKKTPDGWIEIIDYKTGKYVPKEKDLRKDIQPAVYYYLIKESLQVPKVRIKNYYLFKDKTILFHEPDLKEEDLEDLLKTMKTEIEGGTFESKKNRFCSFCDFQILCPQMIQAEAPGPRIQEKIIDLAQSQIYDSPILFLKAALLSLENGHSQKAREFFQEVEKRKEGLALEQYYLFTLQKAQLYLKEERKKEARVLLKEVGSISQEGVSLPGTDYLLEWMELALEGY